MAGDQKPAGADQVDQPGPPPRPTGPESSAGPQPTPEWTPEPETPSASTPAPAPAAPKPAAAPAKPADADDLIGGRYRRTARIGSGGMGVVWRADDEVLGRTVALKELSAAAELGGSGPAGAAKRAMREARIAARLHHPNVIGVYDVVEHRGRPWLVMEYLASRSLADLMKDPKALPTAEVARIGAQLADALTAAHDAGIVHRDVKPANVLLSDTGTVKITDFGISRATGDTTVTNTGVLLGTVAYIAPEVARGKIADARSDVYSLGATLYSAVEGEPPFGVDDNAIALLYRIAHEEIIPPSHAGALGPVLMQMLDRDPERRPTTRQVRTWLEDIADGARPDPQAATSVLGAAAAALARPKGTSKRSLPSRPPKQPKSQKQAKQVPPTAPPKVVPLPTPTPAPPPVTPATPAASATPVTPAAPSTGAKAGSGAAAAAASGSAAVASAASASAAGSAATPKPAAAPSGGSTGSSKTPVLPQSAIPTRRTTPADPGPSAEVARLGRRAVVIGVVVALALIAGTVLLLQHSGNTAAAAGSTPSATAATTASQSAAPSATATPTLSATPTPASTHTVTAPNVPATSAAPTGTATTSNAPSGDVSTQLRDTIVDYYQLMPGNTAQGWTWLTTDYQEHHANGEANYDSFWAAVKSVSISDVTVTLPSTVVATIRYSNKDGSADTEKTSFGLVQQNGRWLIASSSVLSHTGG
ncbi:MAG TPA: protein kinase [Actinocrinis sp.]|nr:protein kinase [Actinocrinis sp.]